MRVEVRDVKERSGVMGRMMGGVEDQRLGVLIVMMLECTGNELLLLVMSWEL